MNLRGPLGFPRPFGVGPFVKGQSRSPPDFAEFRSRGHSYRNFNPREIRRAIESDESDMDADAAVDLLQFIESGRYWPYLEAVHDLLAEWIADSAEVFARRNPDAVEWAALYADVTDQPFPTGLNRVAHDSLGPDRSKAINPPKYERSRLVLADNLVDSLQQRSSLYRSYTPHELHDGYTLIVNDAIPEYEPRAANRVMIDIYQDIEYGRLYTLADEALKMFARLDLDERRSFARRNPGIVMWMSAFGIMNDMLHEEQLQVPFPTLGEQER